MLGRQNRELTFRVRHTSFSSGSPLWHQKRFLAEQQRALLKKSKEEEQQQRREASLLREQTWLQQLQILEHAQKRKKPDPTLERLLSDKINTLNYIELKRETARLITMRLQLRRSDTVSIRSIREMRDTPKVIMYIRSIADEKLEESEARQEGLVCKVKGCRLERIAIRCDTAVDVNSEKDPIDKGSQKFKKPRHREPQPLHMNRFKDYYGNALILCQAPMPLQFADQWQAIWELEVMFFSSSWQCLSGGEIVLVYCFSGWSHCLDWRFRRAGQAENRSVQPTDRRRHDDTR